MKTLLKYLDEYQVFGQEKASIVKVIGVYFFGRVRRFVLIYRLGKYSCKGQHNLLCKYFFRKLEFDYGVYISKKAEIGAGVSFPHPVSIVIGDGVKIGKNAVIYQNCTFGGARRGDWKAGHYPVLGNDVVVFAGAVVIGKIIIGDGCVIGANSVVNKNVPDRTTVAGVPAEFITGRQDEKN